jgi:hypothetical protein
MNFDSGNLGFSDWGSSFDGHPQFSLLKSHIERAVQDLFLNALRNQSDDFLQIFETECKIDDFCSRMILYWEGEENYEVCGEILNLKKRLKEVWKQIPVYERGKELEIREWLKSSF